jgi:hypothetical protein
MTSASIGFDGAALFAAEPCHSARERLRGGAGFQSRTSISHCTNAKSFFIRRSIGALLSDAAVSNAFDKEIPLEIHL